MQIQVEQSRFLMWSLEDPEASAWTTPVTLGSLSASATLQEGSPSWVVLQDRVTTLSQAPSPGELSAHSIPSTINQLILEDRLSGHAVWYRLRTMDARPEREWPVQSGIP